VDRRQLYVLASVFGLGLSVLRSGIHG
jgi:hypothetical protein